MEIHYPQSRIDPRPLCWGTENLQDAIQLSRHIEDVTCADCLAIYYAPKTFQDGEESPNTSLSLWLDGYELGESSGWQQALRIHYDRFVNDEEYATAVNTHIRLALKNLALELEEMDLMLTKE